MRRRISICIMLICLLFCALLLGCSGGSEKAVSPGKDWDIPQPIYPLIDAEPAWSPDGKTVCYFHYGIVKVDSPNVVIDSDSVGLWFVDYDGCNPHLVLNLAASSPNWSPGGDRIVFSLGHKQIFVFNLNDSTLQQLTFYGSNRCPSWSPDGNWIVYNSDFGVGGLWVIDTSGNNAHFLGVGGLFPDWSPDGRFVLYTLDYLYKVDVFSYDISQLTFEVGDYGRARWSPDGNYIIYCWNGQIYLISADGENRVQLTTEGGIAPCFSPDGGMIAYIHYNPYKWSPENGTVWIMNTDGTGKHQLTPSPAFSGR